MIKLTDLDGLKLVRVENLADARDVDRAIEEAVTQGSQGWGVIDEQSVLLAVLIQLRNALQRVGVADDMWNKIQATENTLKGKQMELGRVQKSLTEITKRHGGLLEVIKAQAETIEEVTRERDAAMAAGRGLLHESEGAQARRPGIDLTQG